MCFYGESVTLRKSTTWRIPWFPSENVNSKINLLTGTSFWEGNCIRVQKKVKLRLGVLRVVAIGELDVWKPSTRNTRRLFRVSLHWMLSPVLSHSVTAVGLLWFWLLGRVFCPKKGWCRMWAKRSGCPPTVSSSMWKVHRGDLCHYQPEWDRLGNCQIWGGSNFFFLKNA